MANVPRRGGVMVSAAERGSDMGRWGVAAALFIVPLWLSSILAGNPVWWGLVPLMLIVLGLACTIAVHEFGHAVAGSHAGLRLRWLAIGPVMIDAARGWRPRRNPLSNGAGGFAIFDLGELSDAEVRRGMRRMAAGGPVASLLLGAVFLAAGLGIDRVPGMAAWWLVMTGALSALSAVANALPFRAGAFRSDGCTFLILLRGGAGAASLVRLLRQAQVLWAAERPANWPEAVVAQLEETLARTNAPPPAELDEWLSAAYLLYFHFLDRGLPGSGKGVLRRAALAPREPRLVKRGRYDAINVLTALHLALWDGDAVTAAALLARAPKQSLMRRNSLWLGAEAAIHLARGNATAALKLARRAQRRLVPAVDLSRVNEVERTWWETLIARAEAALAAGPAAETAATAPVVTYAAALPVSSGDWFGGLSGGSPAQAVAWSLYALPGDIRWLYRAPSIAARPPRRLRTVAPPKSEPPPPVTSVVVRPRPAAIARERDASPPVALVKAITATAALWIAAATFSLYVGAMVIALLGEEYRTAAGVTVFAAGLLVDLGVAIWLGRQTGVKWGVLGFFFWIPVFPLYVYKQNRGMRARATSERVRRFPTMATVGVLLLTTVLLIAVMVAIARHGQAEEPVLRPERPSMVI